MIGKSRDGHGGNMKVCVTAIPDFDSGLNFHPLVFLVLAVEAEKHVRKPFSWPKTTFGGHFRVFGPPPTFSYSDSGDSVIVLS